MSTALRHALHFALRAPEHGSARARLPLDPSELQVGDVLVARRANNEYGYFSHATAVIGPGEVLGHHVANGIFVARLQDLDNADELRVLRTSLSLPKLEEVARFMRQLVGAHFHLIALKLDPRWWHCGKAVWTAYMSQGLDLSPDRDLVLPDDIAASDKLTTIRTFRADVASAR